MQSAQLQFQQQASNLVEWQTKMGGGCGRGRGSRVARFAYFIEATHKWHLSKHIFHTYPTHTHTYVGSLFSLLALPGGKKHISSAALHVRQTETEGARLSVCVFVCVAIELGTLRLGVNKSEWGKGAEQKKCSSRKPLSCFATFEHVKFLRSTCRWQADAGPTTASISHSCNRCAPPTTLVAAVFSIFPYCVIPNCKIRESFISSSRVRWLHLDERLDR